jgi:trigger factor
MSLQVEKLEKNTAQLTVTVEAEKLDKAINEAYLKNKSKFNMQGFRKGKAPRLMIEKMYGVGVFYEDAANILLQEEYPKALEESKLDVVARPEIDIKQIEKGKEFIFTATVALKPEVTLGDYKGLEVEKVSIEVTDEEVDAEVAKVQDQNSRLISIEDRAVENGDQTIIDFEGFVDDVAFEGGKGEDYELVIGSHSFVDTFEEQLIGKNIGDKVDVNVTFPEVYQSEELAGKPALFKVEIKAIKAKELPIADDEFASEVSEFETMKEYKADLKTKLEEKKTAEAKTAKENAAVALAVENSSMEIPDAMLREQVNTMLNDFSQRMQQQGLTMEQYMQFTGMTPDKMQEQMQPQAEQRIKTRLVLEAIVKAEKIEASDDDVEKELEGMAAAYKMEIDTLKSYMGEAEKENVKADIAVQKAVDLVVEAAKEV